MIISCPNCGHSVMVHGLGRKPLNIPLKNVCESLQAHSSVKETAQEVDCSPAYVFGVLKANRLKPGISLSSNSGNRIWNHPIIGEIDEDRTVDSSRTSTNWEIAARPGHETDRKDKSGRHGGRGSEYLQL